jgi:hypothetical protein
VKSPCSPHLVGVADAVDETYVDVWFEIVAEAAVECGTLVKYDDWIVVEFTRYGGVDDADVEVRLKLVEDGAVDNGTPVLYNEVVVVELAAYGGVDE